jgi:hypothetical protein
MIKEGLEKVKELEEIEKELYILDVKINNINDKIHSIESSKDYKENDLLHSILEPKLREYENELRVLYQSKNNIIQTNKEKIEDIKSIRYINNVIDGLTFNKEKIMKAYLICWELDGHEERILKRLIQHPYIRIHEIFDKYFK